MISNHVLTVYVCVYSQRMLNTIHVVVIIPVTYLFISAVTQSINPDTVVAQQNAVVRNAFLIFLLRLKMYCIVNVTHMHILMQEYNSIRNVF